MESLKHLSNEVHLILELAFVYCVLTIPRRHIAIKKLKRQTHPAPEFHKILQKAHDYKDYAKNTPLRKKAMGKTHFGLVEFHS